MHTVQKNVLNRAIQMLDSLGLDYYIVIPDAEPIQKGDFVIEPKKKYKHKYPRGTLVQMFRHLGIDKMNIGDVVIVPVGDYDKSSIQGSLASFAHRLWGSGAAITAVAGDAIEIMRVANDSKQGAE